MSRDFPKRRPRFAVSLAVGVLTLTCMPLSRGGSTPSAMVAKGNVNPLSCSAQTSQAIGVLVRRRISYPPAAGFTPLQAPKDAVNPIWVSYVILSDDPSTTLATIPDVIPGGNPVLMFAQSSVASLRSCDYKLADSSGAQTLLQSAEQAMISEGLATSAQLNDPATIFMVSDDPLNPFQALVTAYQGKEVDDSVLSSLAQPTDPGEIALYSELDGNGVVVTAPTPNLSPPPANSILDATNNFKPVAAVVNTQTLSVQEAGYANFAASS